MARMQGSVNLAKNLTIKSLPNLKLTIGREDPPRILCTFLGTVTGTKIKPTSLGESVQFLGTFEVIDKETGESARGSSMYLPGHAETVVADAFSQANGRPIQFALDVGIRYRMIANEDGREYTVHEIGGISEHDPLASLKAQFGIVARAPALAAPVEAPALAAPAEPVLAQEPEAAAVPAEPGTAAEVPLAEAEAGAAKKGSKKAR